MILKRRNLLCFSFTCVILFINLKLKKKYPKMKTKWIFFFIAKLLTIESNYMQNSHNVYFKIFKTINKFIKLYMQNNFGMKMEQKWLTTYFNVWVRILLFWTKNWDEFSSVYSKLQLVFLTKFWNRHIVELTLINKTTSNSCQQIK